MDLTDQILKSSGAHRDSLLNARRAAQKRGEYGTQRLFIGSKDSTAQVLLVDTKGKVRLRMYVDNEDKAQLEFLDTDGHITSAYPDKTNK